MATGGFLEGLTSVVSGEKEKGKLQSRGIGQAASGKGRENFLAGNSDEGKAPLLSVLGSHRFESTPGSAKIRRVKKRP